jgi:hypothetical protein
MTMLRTYALRFAILTAIAAIVATVAAGHRAEAAFCPQYVVESCVVEKDGFRHTEWTNPCFAAERGARVLHVGACLGPICTNIWAPVCSVNPATGKGHTYSNLCWSDVANATLIHKGVCRIWHKK